MHSHEPRVPKLRDRLREATGLNSAACYQCGKCSAGCPMAIETSLRPHDVMRLLNEGDDETLLKNESIWLCATCETCTARCPNGCDPARTIDAIREIAAESAPRPISAFHRSFLDQVRATGRSFELGLIFEYKLRSGNLFQDVTTAPAVLTRGKLKFVPKPIAGADDVRRIFRATEKPEKES